MNEWMNEWTDGCMDGWIINQISCVCMTIECVTIVQKKTIQFFELFWFVLFFIFGEVISIWSVTDQKYDHQNTT